MRIAGVTIKVVLIIAIKKLMRHHPPFRL
jgi:hypothetical protein